MNRDRAEKLAELLNSITVTDQKHFQALTVAREEWRIQVSTKESRLKISDETALDLLMGHLTILNCTVSMLQSIADEATQFLEDKEATKAKLKMLAETMHKHGQV